MVNKKVIYFLPSKENNFKAHATELEEVISDYYQQRYFPFELATNTKLVTRTDGDKTSFVIMSCNNETGKEKEIALIIDARDLNEIDMKLDDKGFFTINETIHHFSNKRRGR